MPNKYAKDYAVANDNGWTIDDDAKQVAQNGPRYMRGTVHIWKIRDGWQVADLINNHFCNHRPTQNLHAVLQSVQQ